MKFISGGFVILEKGNLSMKNQIEVLKADNVKLSEIADKVMEGGELSQRVNQMDNFLRRSNAEIQGISVKEYKNLESLVMNTLKIFDPRIHRNYIVSFRRIKPSGKAEDKEKVFYPILVKFRAFAQ